MRVVKLKRFLVEKDLSFLSSFLSFFFQVAAKTRKSRDFFFICRQKTTHMRISRISTLFFNNNNTYYIYTNTHKRGLFFSLSMTTRTPTKGGGMCFVAFAFFSKCTSSVQKTMYLVREIVFERNGFFHFSF